MPRLDWQLWFAALRPAQANPWLHRLLEGLLEGRPEVTGLFAQLPFAEPPTWVRIRRFDYRFAAPGGSTWWQRDAGELFVAPQRLQLMP
jgi:hypothetical protein